jgi:hypothetical protein
MVEIPLPFQILAHSMAFTVYSWLDRDPLHWRVYELAGMELASLLCIVMLMWRCRQRRSQ